MTLPVRAYEHRLAHPFGGRPQPKQPQQPKAAPAPRVYVGLRAAPQGDLPGVQIEELDPNGPAAAAGLKKGDLVTAVDGTKVGDMAALGRTLTGKQPGQVVKLTVLRAMLQDSIPVQKRVVINVKLVKMPKRAIVGSTNLEHLSQAEANLMPDIIAAFDEALVKVLHRLVEWTILTGEENFQPPA